MSRVRNVNDRPVRGDAGYVLYWMTCFRRTRHNFALDRALEWCRDLGRPLIVLEALRAKYPYASDRLHRFLLDGMADCARRFEAAGIPFHAYVEPTPGAGRGLLRAMSEDAAIVVTDDWPSLFVPRVIKEAGAVVPVRLEAVDGNGLLPLRGTERVFATARSFRGHVQKTIRSSLWDRPAVDPLADPNLPPPPEIPAIVQKRWPAGLDVELSKLPIDHEVPVVDLTGGEKAWRQRLAGFVADRLEGYGDQRNQPESNATSGLSPYLHFGHVSAHEIFAAVTETEGWSQERLSDRTDGLRRGFWGMTSPRRGSWTSSSRGGRSDFTPRRSWKGTTATTPCRGGRRRRSPTTRTTPASFSTPSRNSRRPPPTTGCGTRPRTSSGRRA